MNKYSELEKQIETNSKAKFQCNKCNKKFENIDDFQKHKALIPILPSLWSGTMALPDR